MNAAFERNRDFNHASAQAGHWSGMAFMRSCALTGHFNTACQFYDTLACNNRLKMWKCKLQVIDSYTVHNVGQFIAHTVGHILGIDHDTTDCTCGQQNQCIMNKQAGSIGASFAWRYSKCSVARMHGILQSGPHSMSTQQTIPNVTITSMWKRSAGRDGEVS